MGQRTDVVDVQTIQFPPDARFEPVMRKELPVSSGSGGEAGGDLDSQFGQGTQHFAEGSILATDEIDIAAADGVEGHNEIGHSLSLHA
jgi:hypothetical protein